MNRRNVIKLAGAGGLAGFVSVGLANDEPNELPDYTASKYLELPLHAGDEITGITTFRDEIIVATKYGELFRLRPYA